MISLKFIHRYDLFLLLFLLPLPSLAQQSALETASVVLVDLPQEYQLDGVIEAANQATLSAEVSGRIEEILFDVNDIVKQGEVIVRIRDNEYRARVQRAKATLSETKAGFDDASREFKRVKGLFKDKVISQAGYDKAIANLDSARARVAASQANVNEAQEQLDNTIIRAPYSGIVVERHIELGESTNVGQAIMTGYAASELRVMVNVPQSMISAVRKYRKAFVLINKDEQILEVRKITIFPFADPENHSFRVRLDLPEAPQTLSPGILVKAIFVTDQIQRLMIPVSSLVQRSEVVGVYLVDSEQQVIFRQVRSGIYRGDKVEIIAGLDVGESVALDPVAAGIRLKAQWNSSQ